MRTVNFRSLTATHSKHEQYIYAQHGIYAHNHRTIEILFTDCDNKTRHTFLTLLSHDVILPKIESHHSLSLNFDIEIVFKPCKFAVQINNGVRSAERERATKPKREKKKFSNNFSVTSGYCCDACSYCGRTSAIH